jgi:hypothetical protein
VTARIRLERLDAATNLIAQGPAVLGWIGSGTIGFAGFGDYAQARAAGESAVRILDAWYARRTTASPTEVGAAAFDDTRLLLRGRCVGRVLAPLAVPLPRHDAYGFELAVPRVTWTAVLLELALRIHTQLTLEGHLPNTATPLEVA